MATKKPAAANKDGTPLPTATFVVGDGHISHDGEAYGPGDEIELTEAQAKRLGAAVTPATPASKD